MLASALRSHLFGMVSLFFVVSVVNNYAMAYGVPVPFHIVFRSGSLVSNMVLGWLILRKRCARRHC